MERWDVIVIFDLLVYFPNDCSGRSWTSLKSVAKSLFQIPHVGIGAQALGPSCIAFSGTLTGSWIRSGAAWIHTGAQVICGHPGLQLCLVSPAPAPP